jgi:hypothetical protein
MDISEKKFKVAVDDSAEFVIVMNEFNRVHETDFKVDNTDFWDGVEFVFVSFDTATLDEVFLLGSAYQGSYLRKGK